MDANALHLGVRDKPLFRSEFTGPLRRIAAADIPGSARVTVLVRESAAEMIRAEGARAHSYRRFATFCDVGEQSRTPLDCSMQKARVKARMECRIPRACTMLAHTAIVCVGDVGRRGDRRGARY